MFLSIFSARRGICSLCCMVILCAEFKLKDVDKNEGGQAEKVITKNVVSGDMTVCDYDLKNEIMLCKDFLQPNDKKIYNQIQVEEYVFIKGFYDSFILDGLYLPEDAMGLFVKNSEVTQREWIDYMGDNPSKNLSCGLMCPVDSVSWRDAVLFSNIKSKREGLEECYDIHDDVIYSKGIGCSGYRLPLYKEWLSFSGEVEEDIGAFAWLFGNSGYSSKPIMQKKPNDMRLFDVFGNVEEYVDGDLNDLRLVNLVSTADSVKVVFGQSFMSRQEDLGDRRSFMSEQANRKDQGCYGLWPLDWDDSSYSRGFRLVRTGF
jgi:hypothetical protein